MINAISAADIAFIMSGSTSAWLLSPLECSPQKQNGWTLRFCCWGWIMWKMYNKTIIEFGFHMISWIIKNSCLCYNTDLGFDNSWYHAQPHPIIVYCTLMNVVVILSSNCLCSIAPKFLYKVCRNIILALTCQSFWEIESQHSLSVTHFESWLGMETRLTDVVLEIAPRSRNKSGNIAKIGVEICDNKW